MTHLKTAYTPENVPGALVLDEDGHVIFRPNAGDPEPINDEFYTLDEYSSLQSLFANLIMEGWRLY